jgi:hypothetical protein
MMFFRIVGLGIAKSPQHYQTAQQVDETFQAIQQAQGAAELFPETKANAGGNNGE